MPGRFLAAVALLVLAASPALGAWEWPRGLQRQVEKAHALHEQGKDREALELLNGLVAGTTPIGQARVYAAMGDIEQQRGRYAEAQLAYEQALALNAVSPYERVGLTQALDDEYLRAANHDGGRALLRSYLEWLDETAPQLPAVSPGDVQNSREVIEASRGRVLIRLARHDESEGRIPDAVANIDAAIASEPRPRGEWLGYKIELLCASADSVGCAEAIVERARGRVPAAQAEELDAVLRRLVGDPAVEPTLEAARAAGLISDSNQIARRWPPGYVEAEALVRVYPQFPPGAIRDKIYGWVEIDFQIDPDGKPSDAKITVSMPEGYFDEVALAAFSRWRFVSVVVDEKPVAARSIVRMVFQPE